MTDGPERYGNYDPFEDTGDWPFRDAPPPEESQEREDVFAADVPSKLARLQSRPRSRVAEQIAPEPPEQEPEPALHEPEPALAEPEPGRGRAAAEVADEAGRAGAGARARARGGARTNLRGVGRRGIRESEEDELAPVAEAAEEEIAEEDDSSRWPTCRRAPCSRRAR